MCICVCVCIYIYIYIYIYIHSHIVATSFGVTPSSADSTTKVYIIPCIYTDQFAVIDQNLYNLCIYAVILY